ncbi:agglutinin biogenesis protein MshP [Pseudoduganella danionis]|uniref:Agglutinin biogenesis protein MshP n=1 Tax=Pseudoduganella danionis TaxID=1890295 RepID=A0ABW9SL91_9BURK|nr:agglutinin biogenesis protein MshP [Pseudoduganella danionis]MTW32716.1 agglutinin biogenesis protein MshP [Pseudoduganella danionis]
MRVPSLIRRAQRGFSIVTALFLVVVLTTLAVATMVLSTSQQTTVAIDLLSSRAYEAARAGIEYGLYQKQINGSCVASRSFVPGGSLSGMTVTVLCSVVSTPGMGTSLDLVTITATACNMPQSGACPSGVAFSNSPDYVQRTVTVQF